MDKKTPYLIVGSGRVAKHFSAYFDLLGVEYLQWNRSCTQKLIELANKCNKILAAINDDALEKFISELQKELNGQNIVIHFSGALEIRGAEAVHPLMTFAEKLYSLDEYKSIPFVTIENKMSFEELFPELPNPSFAIPLQKKTLYHALLTIAGNFSTILWNEAVHGLKSEFNLSKEILEPYLRKTMDNFFETDNSLTGPFARMDIGTIQKHSDSLKNSVLLTIYEAFKDFHFGGKIK